MLPRVMSSKPFVARCFSVFALGLVLGIAPSCANPEPKKSETPVAAPSAFYSEVALDGRIYVLGQEKSAKAFATSRHLTTTKTFVGGGPNRETVVFEVDDKQPELLGRLLTSFDAAHGTKLR